MWQRFSERARKAVFFAQEASQSFGEGYVSTEHLLLGLLREADNTASRVLDKLGVDRVRIQQEVEKQLPRGEARPSQDMTLTPRAKRVIDLAFDEARHIDNEYIGTEHLLLGLIREGDGLAGRVLNALGIELTSCREQVIEVQRAEHEGRDPNQVLQDPLVQSMRQQANKVRELLSGLGQIERDQITSRLLALRKGKGTAEMLALLVLSDIEEPLESLLRKKGIEPLILVGALEASILRGLSEDANHPGPSVATTLQTAQGLANGKPLNSAHVILALMELGDNGLASIAAELKLTSEDIRSML